MPPETQPSILIIDDEPSICRNCVKILSGQGCKIDYALSGYDALKMFEEKEFDIIVTDLKMNSLGGMEVLSRVKVERPEIIVIVITGYASVSSAVEVMKMGAFDYLPKPFTPDELRAVVRQAVDEWELQRLNKELQEEKAGGTLLSHQLVGQSSKMKKVIEMIRKVAPTDSTVLIHGESGTGKELIARALHANSSRKNEVFFAIDCGTLSTNLIQNELFGHVKGAFTGADKDKAGILKMAHSGTVFLDEISSLSLEVQAKLLRFLETREFLPLGGVSPQKVDIRLVLATNKDLKEMVAEGSFREDFYYRIFVYPIIVPPLRERKSDILPIAYHFLRQFNHVLGKNIQGFDQNAVNKLACYHWPGNVRQLRNLIERTAIISESEQITASDLPFLDESEELIEHVPSTNEELKQMKKEIRQKAVLNIEKKFVLNALAQSDWNITRAAKMVGLQRTNFQNIMKKCGVKIKRS